MFKLRRNPALEAVLKAQTRSCPFEKLGAVYTLIVDTWKDEGRAALGRVDRYYLLTNLLHRKDMVHPWLYARCREVEADPDGYLDLWAREHYKSTIITFGGAIQEILRDPEITIAIFSHVKPIARKFLLQIKAELETNVDLKRIYPDVLYANPEVESPRWSEEKGIVVKRQGNPKESTVEGFGLVDGMPTSVHFLLRIYDDVVTLESVSTPDQVSKTTNAWALSDNLGARGEDGMMRAWHIGTRYSYADTYQHILDNKILKPRIHAATDDGTKDGNPVLLSPVAWATKVAKTPSPILACQQLMNPAAGNEALFKIEWLKFTDIRPGTLNIYILCDPASSRKKGADSTAMMVIGVDAAWNKYLLDGYRHKMGLTERWQKLRGLRLVWSRMPGVQMVKVGYERYGSTADIEYFNEQMIREKEVWEIHELNWPRDDTRAKYDRIQRLEPEFRAGRFFLIGDARNDKGEPAETRNQRKMREQGASFRILKPVRQVDQDGTAYSLNEALLNEYLVYPFSVHDDVLDACSRIFDIEAFPPTIFDETTLEPDHVE